MKLVINDKFSVVTEDSRNFILKEIVDVVKSDPKTKKKVKTGETREISAGYFGTLRGIANHLLNRGIKDINGIVESADIYDKAQSIIDIEIKALIGSTLNYIYELEGKLSKYEKITKESAE